MSFKDFLTKLIAFGEPAPEKSPEELERLRKEIQETEEKMVKEQEEVISAPQEKLPAVLEAQKLDALKEKLGSMPEDEQRKALDSLENAFGDPPNQKVDLDPAPSFEDMKRVNEEKLRSGDRRDASRIMAQERDSMLADLNVKSGKELLGWLREELGAPTPEAVEEDPGTKVELNPPPSPEELQSATKLKSGFKKPETPEEQADFRRYQKMHITRIVRELREKNK